MQCILQHALFLHRGKGGVIDWVCMESGGKAAFIMDIGLLAAVLIPFLGTVLGAGMVLGLPVGEKRVQLALNGFAAGAMGTAAVVNLLLPGGRENPAGAGLGFALGLGLVLAADILGKGRALPPAAVLILAVVLHNIPEGMAVGIPEGAPGTMIGIAVQNIPDGAVVAVPLATMGMKKRKAFLWGVLSGAVEPLAALGTAMVHSRVTAMGPGLMGFAAGAMGYVVLRELVPRMGKGRMGLVWCALGAGLMLVI